MMKVTDTGLTRRLERLLEPGLLHAGGEALLEGAQTIAADAKSAIIDGAVSGSAHVPSLPFHAPNADSHDLDESIHVGDLIETPGRIQTAVIADSDHAFIEFGTSRMAPRPFLGPAMARNRADVLKRMARPVRKGFVKDGMMVCINVSGLRADALAKMDIRAVWSS